MCGTIQAKMLIDVTPLLLFRAKLYSLTVFIHCSRASQDRTIPLSTIAEQTRLSVEDVEYLLMKSLSVSLKPLSHRCKVVPTLVLMTLICL